VRRSTICKALGRDAIAAHEAEVAAYAHERLGRINSLRLIGTAPGKGGIFSFEMSGAHAHDVATILDCYGIAVRAGTHCAQPLLKRFGVTSTCRASFALYNGKDDVDALVDGIERAQQIFRLRKADMTEEAIDTRIVRITMSGTLPQGEVERITTDLIGALKTVYDPEIPVDIYELGLIYRVDLDDDRNLTIDMTLTAPGCPVAGEMPGWVENAARGVEGIQDVTVNMVFDPPWDASRMSEEAQVALNWW
jgi:FeS assembly SUF system protein